jgi:hypothetical protein
MKNTVLLALLLTGTSPALAEDTLLVHACKVALAHWQMKAGDANTVKPATVQDFSNLTPPRVRMNFEGIINASCTFTSTTKPVGLREICVQTTCQQAGVAKFDEIAELMRRDGY